MRTWCRYAVAGVATVLVAGGCGSRVGREQLSASAGALSLSSAQVPVAPSGAGAAIDGRVTTPDPAAGAAPGGSAVGGGMAVPDPGPSAGAGVGAPARHGLNPAAGIGRSAVATGAIPSGVAGAGAAVGQAATPAAALPAPGSPARPGGGATLAPIVFGTFGTGSGVIGRAVQPIITADKAWSADVNARGGVAGHPVKLLFGDDGGDPAAALAIAKRMVEQDKVVAFIRTYLVTTTPAVTPYLEQGGGPMIGGPGGHAIQG